MLHVLLVKNENSELGTWVVFACDTVVYSINCAGLNLACVPNGPVPTKEAGCGKGHVPAEQESGAIEAERELASLKHSSDTRKACVQDYATAWV